VAGRASGIKMGDDGGGLLISLVSVAPSWIVGVSGAAYVVFLCTIKSRRRFLLALAHPGSPGEMAVKRLCVCACVHACSLLMGDGDMLNVW